MDCLSAPSDQPLVCVQSQHWERDSWCLALCLGLKRKTYFCSLRNISILFNRLYNIIHVPYKTNYSNVPCWNVIKMLIFIFNTVKTHIRIKKRKVKKITENIPPNILRPLSTHKQGRSLVLCVKLGKTGQFLIIINNSIQIHSPFQLSIHLNKVCCQKLPNTLVLQSKKIKLHAADLWCPTNLEISGDDCKSTLIREYFVLFIDCTMSKQFANTSFCNLVM